MNKKIDISFSGIWSVPVRVGSSIKYHKINNKVNKMSFFTYFRCFDTNKIMFYTSNCSGTR